MSLSSTGHTILGGCPRSPTSEIGEVRSRFTGLICSLAFLAASSGALAQPQNDPSLPPPAQTTQPPSISPATPAPAGTLQSIPPAIPATTPGTQVPAATPTTTPPPSIPGYQDPLEQPIQMHAQPQTPSIPAATPESANSLPVLPPYDPDYGTYPHRDELGSTYIPVDSPIYPMALRLYSLGYLDSAFIGVRPWTRRVLLHMLQKSTSQIVSDNNQQAMEILAKLQDYLAGEVPAKGFTRGRIYGADTVYTRLMGIDGQTLRDSFHLGQTIVNDYGRPYEPGFNAIAGFSTINEWGRFSLYVRGEYQHSPSGPGYGLAMANQLSCTDEICPFAPPNDPQATIPYGTQLAQNPFRLVEATLSFHLLGHEISGGKSDSWNGPGLGGAMLWSNNAEDIYSFRINRVEPMTIPLFSRILGPLRYDFFVGSLKGHTAPNSPWIHTETASLRPTKDFEFAFERSVIWGGQGFEPVTLHTFLKSFFNFNDTETDPAAKGSRNDPGARFSDFTFSWRLPYLTHSVTLYLDSICHDDVSPISAPRRAAYRPGLFIAHLPGAPKFDFRIEGASTDTSTLRSSGGQFNYYETIQRQGYTNKGFIMGDWIGREAKGGQAWLTYHLAADEWIQAQFLTKETPKDFVAGGVHQNDYKIDVVKRIHHDFELDASIQSERWRAPVPLTNPTAPLQVIGGPLYFPNAQINTTIAAQLTWHPKLHIIRSLNGK
jgi:hypothetical protein